MDWRGKGSEGPRERNWVNVGGGGGNWSEAKGFRVSPAPSSHPSRRNLKSWQGESEEGASRSAGFKNSSRAARANLSGSGTQRNASPNHPPHPPAASSSPPPPSSRRKRAARSGGRRAGLEVSCPLGARTCPPRPPLSPRGLGSRGRPHPSPPGPGSRGAAPEPGGSAVPPAGRPGPGAARTAPGKRREEGRRAVQGRGGGGRGGAWGRKSRWERGGRDWGPGRGGWRGLAGWWGSGAGWPRESRSWVGWGGACKVLEAESRQGSGIPPRLLPIRSWGAQHPLTPPPAHSHMNVWGQTAGRRVTLPMGPQSQGRQSGAGLLCPGLGERTKSRLWPLCVSPVSFLGAVCRLTAERRPWGGSSQGAGP